MISAYIFSGPTLPFLKLQEYRSYKMSEKKDITLLSGDQIQFLAPVAEGDIFRLVPHKPKVIGIIDGYFENVPSVWHKEILYAMSQGIHVLGASSMGALRGAELARFGMEGVGAIFQAYHDGFLNDDDEVAVVHGPEELGFPLLSEAMVNIRTTIDRAAKDGVFSESEAEALTSIAKELHYKDRRYSTITSQAEDFGIDKDVLRRFLNWLQENRKDQKLEDALALVDKVVENLNSHCAPKIVRYNFENTTIWNKKRSKV